MSKDSFTYGAHHESISVTFSVDKKQGKIRVVPEGDNEGRDSFTLSAAQVRALAKRLNSFADRIDKKK